MMESLAVVRTGLEGEQSKMDVISNNLANINTTGFKKVRAVFADLLYQDPTQVGGFTSQATNYPSGLQQGQNFTVGRVHRARLRGQSVIGRSGNRSCEKLMLDQERDGNSA